MRKIRKGEMVLSLPREPGKSILILCDYCIERVFEMRYEYFELEREKYKEDK